MNLFFKDSVGLHLPEGLQVPEFKEIFEEVPQDYNPTRAVPIDYSDSFLDVCSAITDISSSLEDIESYSSYNSSFGVIPEPYITYFSDLYAQTRWSDYVAFVTQETSGSYTSTVYNCFVGDIAYNGSTFSGNGTLYKYYASSRFPTYVHYIDSNFSYSPGSGAAFTSVSGTPYPDFTSNLATGYYTLYFLVLIFLLICFCSFFDNPMFFKKRR